MLSQLHLAIMLEFCSMQCLFMCQMLFVGVTQLILNELNVAKLIYHKMSRFLQSRLF